MLTPKLEEIAKELAETWAEQENEASSHCGPYGTDTWEDHIGEAREHINEIIKAYEEDKNAEV